jgi:hypothetical protein
MVVRTYILFFLILTSPRLKVQFMLGGQLTSADVQLPGVRESLRWHIVYYNPIIYTSRKHGRNEPHSFSHCGSFDQ